MVLHALKPLSSWHKCKYICCFKVYIPIYLFTLYADMCSVYTVRDSTNDKPFELEMAWCCEDTEYSFRQVPKDVL